MMVVPRRSLALASLISIALAGCATLTRIDGVSEGFSWRATNLSLEKRPIKDEHQLVYSFDLLLQDTTGRGATFTRLDYILYQPGVSPVYRTLEGQWIVQPNGEFRVPLSSYVTCPTFGNCVDKGNHTPLYDLVLRGMDGHGRALTFKANIALPADPTSAAHTAAASNIASVPPPTRSGASPSQTSSREPVVIPIAVANNLVLVPVTFNGSHGGTMLLDTGASYTLITPALAKRLGVVLPTQPVRRRLKLAGGQEIDVPFVRLSSVLIGTAERRELEVGIYEALQFGGLLLDGLLGADILNRYRVTIDQQDRQLRLEPKP